ncbi:glucose-1-phosphate cytidylyltransferase [Paenibacillus sp. TRM 82003]|nr:glucose-1-phosphate cytidylyltransferase [Paenibacillus sp. TRM 82003]
MKVVILAGGYGTRLGEETKSKPKPLVEIGGMPILWHIMKIYASFGFREFIVCLGYKGDMIKDFFANYTLHRSDVTFEYGFDGHLRTTVHRSDAEPWKVTLVDTGENTLTGGRVKRVQSYVGDEPFLLTYGDGVSDVPIDRLLAYHRSHGKLATVTAVQPQGRFGQLAVEDAGNVDAFLEKPPGDNGWINGGFFVMQPEVFDRLDGDRCVLEREPLEGLAKDGQLMAFRHEGFWKPMDMLRDKEELEELWATTAPWKTWK